MRPRYTNEDPSELLPQEEVEAALERLRAIFWQAFSGAFQVWQDMGQSHPEYRHGLTNYCQARFIYDHTVRIAKALLQDVAGVRILPPDHGFLLILVDEQILVRFKKLDRKLRARNYPTQQQRDFCCQRTLPGIPDATRVIAGYVLDHLATSLERIEITFPVGINKEPLWHFPLANPNVVQHPAATELPKTRTKVKARRGG